MADHKTFSSLPSDHWIHKALAKTKKGGLHKSLHVPAGKKIPVKKVEAAEKSKNPKIRKQAVMAENMNPGRY